MNITEVLKDIADEGPGDTEKRHENFTWIKAYYDSAPVSGSDLEEGVELDSLKQLIETISPGGKTFDAEDWKMLEEACFNRELGTLDDEIEDRSNWDLTFIASVDDHIIYGWCILGVDEHFSYLVSGDTILKYSEM